MASSPLTIIPQLISEQYMVELHSPPGRYTMFSHLADYVNTHESYSDRTLPLVRIIVPSSRMASSLLTITPQLISEQYMIELHSLPGRDTIFGYLADYVNTLSPIYDIHLITTQIRPVFYIYTLERSFCLILNIMIDIRHIPRCVIRLLLHLGLYYMRIR